VPFFLSAAIATEISLVSCSQQLLGALAAEISLALWFSVAMRLFGCIPDLFLKSLLSIAPALAGFFFQNASVSH